MSFECEPCHKIATTRDHSVHLQFSVGPCETCGQVAVCAHCNCHGNWVKARKLRRIHTPNTRGIVPKNSSYDDELRGDDDWSLVTV